MRVRDRILAGEPGGTHDIARCYCPAPRIFAAIDSRPDSAAVYGDVFASTIDPAVRAVEQADYQTARSLFQSMMACMERDYLAYGI